MKRIYVLISFILKKLLLNLKEVDPTHIWEIAIDYKLLSRDLSETLQSMQ